MTDRNARSGKLLLLLVALAVLTGFQPGLAEAQNQADDMKKYEATDPIGRKAIILVPRESTDEEIRTAIKQASFSFPNEIEKLRKAAEQGNTNAQKELGHKYLRGWGLPENGGEAAKWYRRAAKQGDAEAQRELGYMYFFGKYDGVPENDQEAARWFHKAAEQGDAKAQERLGHMYRRGVGVAEDKREAVKWYRKAAQQGHTKAQVHLGYMYANGEGVPEDYQEAEKWHRKAAEQAEDLDLLYLAVQYANGVGVPEDGWEAKRLFRLVAKGGHPVFAQAAQRELGNMYYAGKYAVQFGKDNQEAVKWYRKAAEQGDAEAQERLGHMYANGEGVPEDYVKAYAWMNLAAAQGRNNAVKAKELLRSSMTTEQVAEAQKLSADLYKRIEAAKPE